MMRIEVGQVTKDECNEIQHLFERKNGLIELAKIMPEDNAVLYEKIVTDLGETSTKYQQWWDIMALKYNWQSQDGAHWEIDFDTCKIYLKQ